MSWKGRSDNVTAIVEIVRRVEMLHEQRALIERTIFCSYERS
jgi:hypothetical protein